MPARWRVPTRATIRWRAAPTSVTAALSSTLGDFAPETMRALPWPPTRRRRAIPLPIEHRRVGAVLRGAGRYRETHVLLDQLADAPLESTPKANLAHVITIPLRIVAQRGRWLRPRSTESWRASGGYLSIFLVVRCWADRRLPVTSRGLLFNRRDRYATAWRNVQGFAACPAQKEPIRLNRRGRSKRRQSGTLSLYFGEPFASSFQ